MPKESQTEPPGGFETSCYPGWVSLATAVQPPMSVAVGGIGVPSGFHLGVRRVKTTNQEEMKVSLCYFVFGEEVFLGAVHAVHPFSVDEALDALRKARPMDWWKRHAFRQIALRWIDEMMPTAAGGTTDAYYGGNPSEWEQQRTFAQSVASTLPIARRRNRITERQLREVIDVYRAAMERGDPPTKAVADAFMKSHSTAARWVGLARGLPNGLGPADGTKGGEK